LVIDDVDVAELDETQNGRAVRFAACAGGGSKVSADDPLEAWAVEQLSVAAGSGRPSNDGFVRRRASHDRSDGATEPTSTGKHKRGAGAQRTCAQERAPRHFGHLA
jgi:hypothetical protein